MKLIKEFFFLLTLRAITGASSTVTYFKEKKNVDTSRMLTEIVETMSNIDDDTTCSIFCTHKGFSCNGFHVDPEQRQCKMLNLYGSSFHQGEDVIYIKHWKPERTGIPEKLLCGLKDSAESSTVFVKNTKDNTVCRNTTLPSDCVGVKTIVDNRWLYCIGGWLSDEKNSSNLVYVLDLSVPWQDWSWTLKQNLPFPLQKHRIVQMGKKIYAFGGITKKGNILIGNHKSKMFTYNIDNDFWTVKNSLSFDVATTGEFTTAKPIPGSRKILLQTKTSKDILVFDTDVNDIVPEETIVSPVPDDVDLKRPVMFLEDGQGGWTPTWVYQTMNLGTYGLDLNNLDKGFQLISDQNYTILASGLHFHVGNKNGLFALGTNKAYTWNDDLKQFFPTSDYLFNFHSECVAHDAIESISCNP